MLRKLVLRGCSAATPGICCAAPPVATGWGQDVTPVLGTEIVSCHGLGFRVQAGKSELTGPKAAIGCGMRHAARRVQER